MIIWYLILAVSIGYAIYWLIRNYKPFMEYVEKHPSNTAFLEYLGYKEKQNDDE